MLSELEIGILRRAGFAADRFHLDRIRDDLRKTRILISASQEAVSRARELMARADDILGR